MSFPIPSGPVVERPPSSIYRVIRAHTARAIEDEGAELRRAPKSRKRWWKGRKRPTVMVALTEQLHHTLVTVAAQENMSLAATARTLMALGAARYDHLISERIVHLTAAAIEEIDDPADRRTQRRIDVTDYRGAAPDAR